MVRYVVPHFPVRNSVSGKIVQLDNFPLLFAQFAAIMSRVQPSGPLEPVAHFSIRPARDHRETGRTAAESLFLADVRDGHGWSHVSENYSARVKSR